MGHRKFPLTNTHKLFSIAEISSLLGTAKIISILSFGSCLAVVGFPSSSFFNNSSLGPSINCCINFWKFAYFPLNLKLIVLVWIKDCAVFSSKFCSSSWSLFCWIAFVSQRKSSVNLHSAGRSWAKAFPLFCSGWKLFPFLNFIPTLFYLFLSLNLSA